MEQCGYNWAHFHEIILLEGFQYELLFKLNFWLVRQKQHIKYICDILLHTNLTENSCRDRIWAIPIVVYWSNLLISIERLGVILHNIKKNIHNFAVTVEFYIYFSTVKPKYLALYICIFCMWLFIRTAWNGNCADCICIYRAMNQWKDEWISMVAQVRYACWEIGGKLQAWYVLRWETLNLKNYWKY
jgi:hypothetical protein